MFGPSIYIIMVRIKHPFFSFCNFWIYWTVLTVWRIDFENLKRLRLQVWELLITDDHNDELDNGYYINCSSRYVNQDTLVVFLIDFIRRKFLGRWLTPLFNIHKRKFILLSVYLRRVGCYLNTGPFGWHLTFIVFNFHVEGIYRKR